MKQSGIDWIGEIPDDWKIEKFGHVLKERNEKNNPIISTERLSVSIDIGVTLYSDKTTNLDRFKDDFSQYKIAHEGDLVMNSMNVIVGSEGISPYFGCVSPAYYTYYCDDEDFNSARYCDYLFKTKSLKKFLRAIGKGIYAIDRGDDKVNTCRLKVSRMDMKNLLIPLPPKASQQRIAEYLDSKCAQIDSIIEESKKSIEEYKAWKQSVIFEAVTGNLKTESRKLKDETFTDKWQLIKIKYVAEYNTETLPENTKDEFNFNYIDIGSVKFGEGITNFQNMIFKDAPSRARRIVKKDDVIISSVRTYLRAIARIEESEIPQIASTGFVVFSSKPQKILPRFLFYAISSESFVGKVEANSVGISYPAINASQIANFKIPLPPLPKQESIAKMLDSKCAQIDSLIAEKESLIADLMEYKKSLIFEVVTGKRRI